MILMLNYWLLIIRGIIGMMCSVIYQAISKAWIKIFISISLILIIFIYMIGQHTTIFTLINDYCWFALMPMMISRDVGINFVIVILHYGLHLLVMTDLISDFWWRLRVAHVFVIWRLLLPITVLNLGIFIIYIWYYMTFISM